MGRRTNTCLAIGLGLLVGAVAGFLGLMVLDSFDATSVTVGTSYPVNRESERSVGIAIGGRWVYTTPVSDDEDLTTKKQLLLWAPFAGVVGLGASLGGYAMYRVNRWVRRNDEPATNSPEPR